jgi:hypothetical protein
MLTSAEVRGKWVLSVEDWAEIRRLHRAERMPIKVIARVVGCSKNTVKSALAADQPPTYRRQPRGSGSGCGGATYSGVAAGLSDDAGHGDRGTD